MKKLTLISLTFAALVVVFLACGAHKADASRDAGVLGAHKLGVTLNDAGLPIDDAGAVSLVLDGGGIGSIFGDPPVDHCTINQVYVDPPTCNFTANVSCGARMKLVSGQLSAAQCAAVFNLVRTAAANGGIQ